MWHAKLRGASYDFKAFRLTVVSYAMCTRRAGKTPEEIRKTFGIKNDFTPEEEEQVRRENEWCEER
jgi:hypothetical protein